MALYVVKCIIIGKSKCIIYKVDSTWRAQTSLADRSLPQGFWIIPSPRSGNSGHATTVMLFVAHLLI